MLFTLFCCSLSCPNDPCCAGGLPRRGKEECSPAGRKGFKGDGEATDTPNAIGDCKAPLFSVVSGDAAPSANEDKMSGVDSVEGLRSVLESEKPEQSIGRPVSQVAHEAHRGSQ